MRQTSIEASLSSVTQRLRSACIAAGRDPAEVTLLAVSKTHPAAAIQTAYAAGQRQFGESRVQELKEKALALNQLDQLGFHFIGHLQSNKARAAAAVAHWIHSVHSLKLLEILSDETTNLNRPLNLLFEVHLSPEPTKSGASPELLPALLERAMKLPGIVPRGLMTMPPWDEDPEASRPYFQELRRLRDKLRTDFGLESFNQLSMGMSGDFQVAIQEGSTIVRVGTAIFGER